MYSKIPFYLLGHSSNVIFSVKLPPVFLPCHPVIIALSSLSRGDVFIVAATGLTFAAIIYVPTPVSFIVLFAPKERDSDSLLQRLAGSRRSAPTLAGFNCILVLSFLSPRQGDSCILINQSPCLKQETSFPMFLFCPVSASCSIIPYPLPEFLALDS